MRIACLLSLAALAFSQPPPPTPTKSGQEKQKSTAGEDTKTEDSKSGSQPVTVTVINAPEVQDPSKRHDDQPPANWWMRSFTFFIFLATATQAYIYWRQKQLMADTLIETRRSVDAARTTIILAQPPRLIVHNITLLYERGGFLATDKLALLYDTMRFYITNEGGTPATIINWHADRCIKSSSLKSLPMESPFEDAIPRLENIVMASGVSIHFDFQPREDTSDNKVKAFDGRAVMWIIGWIEYEDGLKNRRRAKFCRQWNRLEERFIPTNNPDYENAQ